jgi:hypothetical protein
VLGLITFALLLMPAFVRVAWFYFTSPKGACRAVASLFIFAWARHRSRCARAAAARGAARRCAATGALRAQRLRAAACSPAPPVLSSVADRR